jgi:hypothetical protein
MCISVNPSVLDAQVVDYFKPVDGASWCVMVASNNQHQWSQTGLDGSWKIPDYHTSKFLSGGSAVDWPTSNVDGDTRKYLSFWGDDRSTQPGGCCSSSFAVRLQHNQAFTLSYGVVSTSTTTITITTTTTSTATAKHSATALKEATIGHQQGLRKLNATVREKSVELERALQENEILTMTNRVQANTLKAHGLSDHTAAGLDPKPEPTLLLANGENGTVTA